LIGPSGLLLLVVSNQLVSILVFQFYRWDWTKVSKYNLDVRNYVCGVTYWERCWWWKWLQIVSATKRLSHSLLWWTPWLYIIFNVFSLFLSLSFSVISNWRGYGVFQNVGKIRLPWLKIFFENILSDNGWQINKGKKILRLFLHTLLVMDLFIT